MTQSAFLKLGKVLNTSTMRSLCDYNYHGSYVTSKESGLPVRKYKISLTPIDDVIYGIELIMERVSKVAHHISVFVTVREGLEIKFI